MKGILFRPEILPAKFKAIEQYGEAETRRAEKSLAKINQEPEAWQVTPTMDVDTFAFINLAQNKRFNVKPRYRSGETIYIKEAYYIIGTFRPDHIGFDDRVQIKYSPDGAITWIHKPRNKPIHLIGYHSPLMMPEWAARHHITIIKVWPARLKDINEKEAIKEGFKPFGDGTATYFFASCWNQLNKKRGYPWVFNPWVWAYKFKKAKNEQAR